MADYKLYASYSVNAASSETLINWYCKLLVFSQNPHKKNNLFASHFDNPNVCSKHQNTSCRLIKSTLVISWVFFFQGWTWHATTNTACTSHRHVADHLEALKVCPFETPRLTLFWSTVTSTGKAESKRIPPESELYCEGWWWECRFWFLLTGVKEKPVCWGERATKFAWNSSLSKAMWCSLALNRTLILTSGNIRLLHHLHCNCFLNYNCYNKSIGDAPKPCQELSVHTWSPIFIYIYISLVNIQMWFFMLVRSCSCCFPCEFHTMNTSWPWFLVRSDELKSLLFHINVIWAQTDTICLAPSLFVGSTQMTLPPKKSTDCVCHQLGMSPCRGTHTAYRDRRCLAITCHSFLRMIVSATVATHLMVMIIKAQETNMATFAPVFSPRIALWRAEGLPKEARGFVSYLQSM